MSSVNLTRIDTMDRKEIVEKIIAYAKKSVAPDEIKLLTSFIRQYFSNVPIEDLSSREPAALFGGAYSHWQLLKTRQPHQSKIRVFNPSMQENGWSSTHTIVEIIHDDIPFLVDSLRMEINRLGYTIHLIIHSGGLKVSRDQAGNITTIFPYDSASPEALIEAPIYLEIDKQTDPDVLLNITENLQRVLNDVRLAVTDWQNMKNRVGSILEELTSKKYPLDPEDIEESTTFLRWLMDDHFTFLGSRKYKMVEIDGEKALQLIPNTGLGVLKNEERSKIIRYFHEIPPKARKQALSKQLLIISKTNTVSTIHRGPTYTDYIGVKEFDESGELVGLTLFIGLYTSDAYNTKLSDIPFIRRKVETILQKSGLSHNAHALKTLINILDTFPRDDIFQGNVDLLCDISVSILHLQDRKKIRLFVLPDDYGRYVSCLVYVPRDNLSTDLIYRMQAILVEAFDGHKVSFTTYFPESILARIHFVIRLNQRKKLHYDIKEIEEKLVEIGRSWKDGLQEEILTYFGEEKGSALVNKYSRAFPAGYRETYTPKQSIYDIKRLEQLSQGHTLVLNIYRPLDAKINNIRLKLYRLNDSIPLSDALPILENMGLRVIGEQPFQVSFENPPSMAWINDFNMLYNPDAELDVAKVKNIFQEAFHCIWHGNAENDGFNKLVLAANLTWREISVLRAYAKYLRQVGFTFSQNYIEECFSNNPTVVRLLMDLFNLTFDPEIHDKIEKITSVEDALYEALENVANLDEDRIFRRYLEVMKATLRTNFFQKTKTGEWKSYISFKFNPSLISEIPLPIPVFETFVYSTDFEGVHLRGPVSRGGIRWSTRREDFRTEILGLMKAQQVKNAIIVPSGAKGGFVIKNLPVDASHATVMEWGVFCYKNFIRGLLDLADNYVAGTIVKPNDTICFDGEDPYLVVAADKGTATFSDLANEISHEYKFWLGDAFASGGSAGYDHKKMGITARGAWESVKCHFRELNIDPYHDDFTMVGIGDMAGDVFGNGCLYTDHIKLIAAFNHTHIFIDPNPDPKLSYFERLRLFKLPSSTWENYDPNLISKGGGVFSRSVKSIKLSPEACQALGIVNQESIVPNDLIRAILKAPVDLLWNGGIGTFVKANNETHAEIGDRTNDSLRINGNELNCKVVAEGGNLGLTQLGRIEYELSGGKINTDFIDNSGGVDCSDHEVNIKILLNQLTAEDSLNTKDRNHLLSAMTDEVAQLVLLNNYCQTRAISFAVSNSMEYLELYRLFMHYHEANGNLNRSLEFLPDDKTLNERKADSKGLTRPEIAVLMAYSKNILKKEILSTNLPEEPSLLEFIEYAFPMTLCKRYENKLPQHQLKREIIATQLSNSLVMEMGTTFVFQMNDENNATTEQIVRGYIMVRRLFNLDKLWKQVESLEHKISIDVLNEMILDIMRLGRRATRWLLLNKRTEFDIDQMVAHFSTHLKKLSEVFPNLLFGQEKEKLENRINELQAEDVPQEIAIKISSTRLLYSALNIIEAATTHRVDVIEVAKIYFKLMERLELIWFREKINDYPVDNHWAVLARADYKGDLDYLQRVLTVSVIKMPSSSAKVEDHVEKWLEANKKSITRWKSILGELRSSSTNEFAMLTVAMRGLLELANTSNHIDRKEGLPV